MSKKIVSGIIIVLNIIGLFCLIYFAVPYFMHDTAISNPEAMIPFQRWESSGIILTIGFFPLAIVNVLAALFVGKGKIKKPFKVLFLVPCVLCLGIVVHYWALGFGDVISNSLPVAKVKIEFRDTSEIQYGVLYGDGGLEVIDEAFEMNGVEVFVADVNNFTSDEENGKVVNSLVSTVIKNDQGNKVEADDLLKKLLQNVADTIEHHEIIEAKIFKDDQMYFVAVQTNVNWQESCDFYMYNQGEGELTSLYNWDNVNVLGVQCLS